jgi:hypothetical protein
VTVAPLTVADLIAELQKHPPDLPVVCSLHSEYCLLETGNIAVKQLCAPRPDGWVACARPDKPTQPYLLIA